MAKEQEIPGYTFTAEQQTAHDKAAASYLAESKANDLYEHGGIRDELRLQLRMPDQLRVRLRGAVGHAACEDAH